MSPQRELYEAVDWFEISHFSVKNSKIIGTIKNRDYGIKGGRFPGPYLLNDKVTKHTESEFYLTSPGHSVENMNNKFFGSSLIERIYFNSPSKYHDKL